MFARFCLILCVFIFVQLDGSDLKLWDANALNSYFKNVERELGWKYFGSGSSNLEEEPVLVIDFCGTQRLTVPEARKLYIAETQKVINRYREKQKSWWYASKVAFSAKHLDYVVGFVDPSYEYYEFPFVAKISTIRGEIIYKTYDPEKSGPTKFQTIHREPYEEALRIVQEELQHGSY